MRPGEALQGIVGRAMERMGPRRNDGVPPKPIEGRLVLDDPRGNLIGEWPWDGSRDEQLAGDIVQAAEDWAQGADRDGSCQLTGWGPKEKRLGSQPVHVRRAPAPKEGLAPVSIETEHATITKALLASHKDLMAEMRLFANVTLQGVAQLAQANALALSTLSERIKHAEDDRAKAVQAAEAAIGTASEAVGQLEVERSKSAKVDRLLTLVGGTPVVRELVAAAAPEKKPDGQ